MKIIRKLVRVLIIFIILFVFYGLVLIYLPGEDGDKLAFEIAAGKGVNQISRDLYQNGLIKNKLVFEIYVWARGVENKIQAGEYELNRGINIYNLVNKLISGESLSREKNITIIEGWNLRNIQKYLEEQGFAEVGDLSYWAGFPAVDYWEHLDLPPRYDFSEEYDFLESKPKNISLEGYIFPDTYRVYRHASTEDIIRKALDNFNQKLTEELRQEIKRQGRTIHEVITLASIVEKEAGSGENKKMVADIFLRRLAAGIPLQSDATVNYVTLKNITRPSLEDTEVDSSFNTYKYRGLPLGPISNPGLESIEAVLYPRANNYWYFLTTPEGEFIYSKTHDEHVANKQKYLR